MDILSSAFENVGFPLTDDDENVILNRPNYLGSFELPKRKHNVHAICTIIMYTYSIACQVKD